MPPSAGRCPIAFLWLAPRYGIPLLVHRDRPLVFGARVGRERRNSLSEQFLHTLPDKPRAVTFPDHVGFADVLVDPPGFFGKIVEMMLWPPMHGIILHIGKWPFTERDDPARHAGVSQFLFVKGSIAVPPKADMRSLLPIRQKAKVGHRRSTEAIACNFCHSSTLGRRANGRHAASGSEGRLGIAMSLPHPVRIVRGIIEA